MTETFRSLRTNLLFMMGDPDKKVVLVTSTISGEGKTFIASNLALSLALLGKKVILVGLDIRKPGLNKLFHLSHKEKGITQYLVAPKSTDLHALIQPSGITSNLDLLLGGHPAILRNYWHASHWKTPSVHYAKNMTISYWIQPLSAW